MILQIVSKYLIRNPKTSYNTLVFLISGVSLISGVGGNLPKTNKWGGPNKRGGWKMGFGIIQN